MTPSIARTIFNCIFAAPLVGALSGALLQSSTAFWIGTAVGVVLLVSDHFRPRESAPAMEPVDDAVRCPKCRGTQLDVGNKGFGAGKALGGGLLLGPVGLLGGFIGSKKVMLTCLKCGNRWKAGS